jgi:hypothetical protein
MHEADAGKALTHEHVELLDVGHGADVQMSRKCGKGRADRSSAGCRCTVLYNGGRTVRPGGSVRGVRPAPASLPVWRSQGMSTTLLAIDLTSVSNLLTMRLELFSVYM